MAKKKTPRTKPRRDIYQEVTDKIIDSLDRGVAPWRSPIVHGGDGFPKSLSTGKVYRGINTFLLAMVSWAEGFGSDYWMTFNQAKDRGGQVRKGEKGALVVFWKQYTKEDPETKKEITLPVLRHYTVFNADQVDGVEVPKTEQVEKLEHQPVEAAEAITAGYQDPPQLILQGLLPSYRPKSDTVAMPLTSSITSAESYYATLFHELAHSTGHEKRLSRGLSEKLAPFGSPDYSKEELVAEFGSAFLCAAAGISPPTIELAAAYIDGWRKKLKDDKRLVVQAAGQGQRAADHILGVRFEEEAGDSNPRPPPTTPAEQRELF